MEREKGKKVIMAFFQNVEWIKCRRDECCCCMDLGLAKSHVTHTHAHYIDASTQCECERFCDQVPLHLLLLTSLRVTHSLLWNMTDVSSTVLEDLFIQLVQQGLDHNYLEGVIQSLDHQSFLTMDHVQNHIRASMATCNGTASNTQYTPSFSLPCCSI